MDLVRITSSANSVVKEVRSLHNKKGRMDAQALLLEGYRLVLEAINSGNRIRYIIISDSFYEKSHQFINAFLQSKFIQIPDSLFTKVSGTQNPQGIMAVIDIPEPEKIDQILKLKRVIALENLQDPGNLGTIIRTADACGFDGVILSKGCVDHYNPKVIRSTMGSLFHLPVYVADDIYSTLEAIKMNHVRIVIADIRDALPCWEADLSKNVAIVIGNEGEGITDRMRSLADVSITVPMAGKAESMNASSAASILMYESMRQMKIG